MQIFVWDRGRALPFIDKKFGCLSAKLAKGEGWAYGEVYGKGCGEGLV